MKHQYLSLCREQGQLILAFITERTELNPSNLRSYRWGQFSHLGGFAQEVWKRWIRIEPMLNMAEWLKRWEHTVRVPSGKVLFVLVVRLATLATPERCPRTDLCSGLVCATILFDVFSISLRSKGKLFVLAEANHLLPLIRTYCHRGHVA